MTTEARDFYKSLFHVVGPIACQNLISAAVNSADVIMLGYVGQTAIAGASLAGQIMFILYMLATGLSSGLVMLAAQYWGKKDIESIRTLHGISLRISGSVGIVFALAAAFCPEFLMRIWTDNESLISTGAEYLRAMSVSYVAFTVSQVFQAGFKSIERVKVVTIITSSALALNILLNATFIFGLFGAPKLGIVGVGLATSIARVLELIFCLIYAARQKDVRYSLATVFRRNSFLTHDFLKYSMPAVGNELVWGVAASMYSMILGHLGEDIVAANSVVSVIMQLCTVVCFGMAYGGAVVIGKTIGSGDLQLAERNSGRLIRITMLAGLAGSILILCARPVLPLIAELTETATRYSQIMLYIISLNTFGAATNTAFICGIFRAGGDARFGLIIDFIIMWLVSVPLGLLCAFALKLPPMLVYLIIRLDEFEKMPFIIIHYFKKTWLKNITR